MKNFIRFWKAYEWRIIGFYMLFCYILGVIGTYQLLENAYKADPNNTYKLVEPLYKSMQLFFMGSYEYSNYIPLTLHIVRFLSPLALGYAAVKTVIYVVRDELNMLKIRRYQNHTIVVWLNNMSVQLIHDLLKTDKLIVITEQTDHPEIEEIKNQGGVVLIGNLSDTYLLQRAGIERANYLISFADDAINITLAQNIKKVIKGHNTNLKCFVQISEQTSIKNLNSLNFFTYMNTDHANFEIQTFNIYERASRLILRHHGPDMFKHVTTPDAPQLHILIAGFGALGQTVFVQAARMAHYYNLKKLKITVLDPDAEVQGNKLLKRYKEITNIIDYQFISSDLDVLDEETMNLIEQDLPIAGCYQCIEHPNTALSFLDNYLYINADDKKPLLLALFSKDNMLSFIPDEYNNIVHLFDIMDETCTREAIINESIDSLAISIHNDYIKKQKAAGTFNPQKASHRDWNTLSLDFKEQNRNQADNIYVKVRALECSIAPLNSPEPAFDFTKDKDVVERLAEMEHNRWNAHLWINGWKYGEKRDDKRKLHTDLVPYHLLSDPVKQYDRDAIMNLPMLLNSLGFKIVKRTDFNQH